MPNISLATSIGDVCTTIQAPTACRDRIIALRLLANIGQDANRINHSRCKKIPADGEIVEGGSQVDESMVTGESVPTKKQPGDEVIGVTMNKHRKL